MFSQIHTTVIYIQNDRFDSAESQNTLVCLLSGFYCVLALHLASGST